METREEEEPREKKGRIWTKSSRQSVMRQAGVAAAAAAASPLQPLLLLLVWHLTWLSLYTELF